MRFTKNSLHHFFQYFQKELNDAEVSRLLEGNGGWNPSQETLIHIQKIQKYRWIFSLVPGLKAVFFCNTTAFRAANAKSDIDLFVVAENEQMWTVRVFLTFLTHILAIRRHGKHIAQRFCLSFFATESGAFSLESLQLRAENDPYLAIWTATAECFIADSGFLQRFQKKNDWILAYGLHFTQQTIPSPLSSFQKLFGIILRFLRVETLFRFLFLSRTLQKASQLKNKRGTIISDQFLKFHNEDIREEIAKSINTHYDPAL